MGEFVKELEALINRFSKENGSDTPDFILSDMVKAILDGRKTQTRRVISPQPRVGTDVECLICKKRKAPIGRSISLATAGSYCNFECYGYYQEPKADYLFPNESDADFGFHYKPKYLYNKVGGRLWVREIKFRGRRLTDGEWIYGSLVITNWKEDKRKRYFIVNGLGNYTFNHEVRPESVGQCTGLKDKNRKEIYEGDIFSLGDKKILYIVEWNDTGLTGRQYDNRSYVGLRWWRNNIEIIGNIHSNPELLNNHATNPKK